MRRLLLIAWLASASCADDPGLIAPTPCVCAEEGACGDDYCSFSFSLDESCEGRVSVAELLIDGHLESEPLRYPAEEPLVPCSRTAPGETSEIFVRGGSWLWGSEEAGGGPTDPMLLTCDAPGTIHQRTFECRDKVGATPPVDDETLPPRTPGS